MSRRRAESRVRGVCQEGTLLIETGMMSLYSDVSLDSLVEEVVESVYAGHSYQQLSGSLGSRSGTMAMDVSPASTVENDDGEALHPRHTTVVAIYLNIEPSARWMFHTQPGAIRRIVMNLFGNALKYTSRVSLLSVSLRASSARRARKDRVGWCRSPFPTRAKVLAPNISRIRCSPPFPRGPALHRSRVWLKSRETDHHQTRREDIRRKSSQAWHDDSRIHTPTAVTLKLQGKLCAC